MNKINSNYWSGFSFDARVFKGPNISESVYKSLRTENNALSRLKMASKYLAAFPEMVATLDQMVAQLTEVQETSAIADAV